MRKHITPNDVLRSIKKVIELDSNIFIPTLSPRDKAFLSPAEKQKMRREISLARKLDVCAAVKKEIRNLTITRDFACFVLKLHCHYNTLPLFIEIACQELVKNKSYKNHPKYSHSYNCIQEIIQANHEYRSFKFKYLLGATDWMPEKEIQDIEDFLYNLARKHEISLSWLDNFPVKHSKHDLFAHFFVYPFIITKAPYI